MNVPINEKTIILVFTSIAILSASSISVMQIAPTCAGNNVATVAESYLT